MYEQTLALRPIGVVHNDGAECAIEIAAPYRAGLQQLDQFSHVNVFWWAHDCASDADRATLAHRPGYAHGVTVGVFASRAEQRPNPIALTACYIIAVDVENGIVRVPWIDAADGSPVLDLKPYLPVSDRIREVQTADWFAAWPQAMEDAVDFEFDPAWFAPFEE